MKNLMYNSRDRLMQGVNSGLCMEGIKHKGTHYGLFRGFPANTGFPPGMDLEIIFDEIHK